MSSVAPSILTMLGCETRARSSISRPIDSRIDLALGGNFRHASSPSSSRSGDAHLTTPSRPPGTNERATPAHRAAPRSSARHPKPDTVGKLTPLEVDLGHLARGGALKFESLKVWRPDQLQALRSKVIRASATNHGLPGLRIHTTPDREGMLTASCPSSTALWNSWLPGEAHEANPLPLSLSRQACPGSAPACSPPSRRSRGFGCFPPGSTAPPGFRVWGSGFGVYR